MNQEMIYTKSGLKKLKNNNYKESNKQDNNNQATPPAGLPFV